MRRAWALLVGCGALVACGSDAGPDGRATLPAVDLVPLEGSGTVATDAIEGPAVVNLWATWCPPCLREIPEFEAVHRQRDDVTFVGVNVGETSDVAADFLAEVGATYQQLLDPDGALLSGLGASTMPVTVVIDGSGHITTVHSGEMSQDALVTAIDSAVGG